MSTLAIEINDTAVTVADESGVLATEPGYALLADGKIIAGRQAYQQARLKPRQVSNRYWASLSLESGSSGLEGIDNAAELAYAQLQGLWDRFKARGKDVILVVPGTYRREQLGVLLGLAQECNMPVRGMVDAAVAASARPYPGHQLVYVDAGLHWIGVTPLEQADEVAAQPVQGFDGTGLAGLTDLWAKRVAEIFVLSTRLDPFHHADTEQLLYERLPDWLRTLQEEGRASLELPYGSEQFEVEVEREQLLGVAAGFYRALVQLISQVREAGASLVVQVSDRLVELPGLVSELLRLDDAHVLRLQAGHAALGALANLDAIGAGNQQVKLIRHLPWREQPASGLAATRTTPEAARSGGECPPTHVLYRGVAYPVDDDGLTVGRAALNGRRAIVLSGRHTGVSRSHCELVLRDGELRLVDLSRHGTFVNEKRISKEAILRPADVIRIGSPGEELQVIAIESKHGAS